jgi:hypothetical protein
VDTIKAEQAFMQPQLGNNQSAVAAPDVLGYMAFISPVEGQVNVLQARAAGQLRQPLAQPIAAEV